MVLLDVEVITGELPNVIVHSVYIPPSEQCVLPPLGHRSLPKIVIEDFNSHNTIWGCDATDNNGVSLPRRHSLHEFGILQRSAQSLPPEMGGPIPFLGHAVRRSLPPGSRDVV